LRQQRVVTGVRPILAKTFLLADDAKITDPGAPA
jgi:hypothetical protein